jgi:hypothetical protein
LAQAARALAQALDLREVGLAQPAAARTDAIGDLRHHGMQTLRSNHGM